MTNGPRLQWNVRIMILMLGIMLSGYVSEMTAMEDSPAQMRIAYLALSQLRTSSSSAASFREFRNRVKQAEDSMGLLRDTSSTDYKAMEQALSYYQWALSVWRKQEDSNEAVDSLRTDEADGAAVMAECPGIATFRLKSADRIRIGDAVACLHGKGAEALARVSESP